MVVDVKIGALIMMSIGEIPVDAASYYIVYRSLVPSLPGTLSNVLYIWSPH